MAYAAITSLMSTIEQSMRFPRINLQEFYEKLESLRAIMENNSCNITGDLEALTSLEAQIAELAYRAEHMVDSKSIKVVCAKSASLQSRAFWKLCCFLERVIGHIDATMKQWMAIRDWYNNIKAHKFTIASIPENHALESENMMVGLENEFEMLQDQLTRGASELEAVSIVGMGGIGKTTLASKIYADPFIMSHFDILAKATVSQEYSARNVLLGMLSSSSKKNDEFYDHLNDGQLADRLQKHLKGNRYLVVIDDIWTEQAWDDMRRCFPDCDNGSRILMTTRNMEVAEYASSGKPPYQMRLMDFDESWSLLYKKIFVNECFPPEFEQLGKQIALRCRGLPLAIVVIAGLLSKTGKALKEWQCVAENITSLVNTDIDVQCMKVLALSYHHLPHHLKACFLYLAIFPEDKLIFVDRLVKLWAAEGFLKVEKRKSIEEVAENCLKDLIDRSLIFIHHLTFDGKIKACRMHDVIRELCLREARTINCVHFIDQSLFAQTTHFSTKRRGWIGIQSEPSTFIANQLDMRISTSLNGNSKVPFYPIFYSKPMNSRKMQELVCFKILRVLDIASLTLDNFPHCIVHSYHLRYLALSVYFSISYWNVYFPRAIAGLQYLQTFILKFPKYSGRQNFPFKLPWEIFKMSQLRYLSLDMNHLDRYDFGDGCWVLRNLQRLSGWNPIFCTSSFFKLFPNVKKLKICGNLEDYRKGNDKHGFHDLRYFNQLEELKFKLRMPFDKAQTSTIGRSKYLVLPPPGSFPKNLKKLAFTCTHLPWEQLRIVCKLPKLEALKLGYGACIGKEWQLVEEQFPRLKFLLLEHSSLSFQYWRASNDHFPCLERLFIKSCQYLDSIPQDFAEITTLVLIEIINCAESVVNSAKQIQQDIQENYASSVEVHIS